VDNLKVKPGLLLGLEVFAAQLSAGNGRLSGGLDAMPPGDSEQGRGAGSTARFATTHWSTVLRAGNPTTPGSCEALEKLCRTYWYPLYVFVRRKGYSPEDAKDLTQSFFERFLEKHYLKDVLAEKGHFRSFLLTALQRFLADQFDRSTAAKRGGGLPIFSLEAVQAEAQFDQAAASLQTPEALFDRAWAETVLQNSLERLRAEYEAAGQRP
jgi:RNA polymerase sigma-70 factor (ECF subfamily)